MSDGDGDAALRLTGNQPSTIELLRKDQTRFARILEVEFHSLTGIPNLSKTVRMLAHTSRTIHSNCVALFRRYQEHGGHILNTLIPMLKEGVDLNEPTITAGSLEKCFTVVKELLNETTTVNKNYAELVPRLKQLKQDILQQNEATDEKASSLRNQLADVEREEYKLEVQQRIEVDRYEHDTVDSGEEKFLQPSTTEEAVFSVVYFISACVMIGTVFSVLFGAGTVIVWLYLCIEFQRITKRNNKARQRRSFDSSSETAAFGAKLQQLKMEKDRIQSELEAINGSFLIVDHVEKAIVILTGILQQMDRLDGFWQRMLGNIGPLATPAGAADLHQKTRQEDLYDTLMRKLTLTESGWRKFGDACAIYIHHAGQDILQYDTVDNAEKFLQPKNIGVAILSGALLISTCAIDAPVFRVLVGVGTVIPWFYLGMEFQRTTTKKHNAPPRRSSDCSSETDSVSMEKNSAESKTEKGVLQWVMKALEDIVLLLGHVKTGLVTLTEILQQLDRLDASWKKWKGEKSEPADGANGPDTNTP